MVADLKSILLADLSEIAELAEQDFAASPRSPTREFSNPLDAYCASGFESTDSSRGHSTKSSCPVAEQDDYC